MRAGTGREVGGGKGTEQLKCSFGGTGKQLRTDGGGKDEKET
jgi:hypothetical protein